LGCSLASEALEERLVVELSGSDAPLPGALSPRAGCGLEAFVSGFARSSGDCALADGEGAGTAMDISAMAGMPSAAA
jgi:hypothetical protein